MLVREIMTENPAVATPDTPLQEVAQMMVRHDCGAIPIVDNEETKIPTGVITDRDICCRVVAEGRNPLNLTAGDAMTSNVRTVSLDTTVEDCCNVMEEEQIRRIPVVDENGSCCGIVAQADIAINASDSTTAEVVQEVSKASA